MRGAIGVRINDGASDQTVTADVSGLKFSRCSDGGHKVASFTITVAAGTFTDLGPADRVYLYDTRTGLTLWEGYLDAPTPTTGPNGETYQVSALGGMIRASDETRSLIYLDKSLSQWEKDPLALNSSSYATASAGQTFADGEVIPFPTFARLRVAFTSGSVAGTSDFASAGNYSLERANMSLGALYAVVVSGKSDSGYRATVQTPLNAIDVGVGGGITAGAVNAVVWAGTHFTSGAIQRVALRLRRTGGPTNIADEQTWTDFVDVNVLGQRVDRNGTLLVGQAGLVSPNYILASWVVEDLLGRLLTFCNPAASYVGVTLRHIDQLAYPDGATAQQVLDDLSDYEPNMLWEILNDGIFNYRPWPTRPRYEISTADGYAESGSDTDLSNRVVVTWTDATGNTRTTIVTATSAQYPALHALEATGRVRDADPITLPEGLGSLANAQAIGAAILADSAGQPTSARAVVRRPIRDLYTGAMVMPWEIETGYPAIVRATGKVLRLTEMEYDDDSVSAALTLGYPSLTREQRIAALSRAS